MGLEAVMAFAWAVITNPLTGWAVGGLVSFVLALIFARYPATKAQARRVADYLEAIERQAVLAAELAGFVRGLKGYDKLLFALDYVEARLAEQGIVGDPDRVTRERLLADLEALKQELFPGKGILVGHLLKANTDAA
jgi:hypothetical protein